MLLVVAVCVGVAIFCFVDGYIVAGIASLVGVSGQIGFLALAVCSVMLFAEGHPVVASVPIALIVWNVVGAAIVKRKGLRLPFNLRPAVTIA